MTWSSLHAPLSGANHSMMGGKDIVDKLKALVSSSSKISHPETMQIHV